ncbi:FG-GAP-like repeat-containing protein [Hymenobacter tibetensis]|uniref:FG-GAP-like repeat-containing protein n=1 Tax=Hymenobacter tibetensis TaxID=497967 RepID=A0ABY4CWZ6_9BACT|nr:FG-GAP-like repeat-containing protein [Hymenobacter tibetensis]UOG74537.1 FG-GAP-like repeat-containing protein [Hymenobacter tibetensis]
MTLRFLLPLLVCCSWLCASPAVAQSTAFGFELRSVAKVVQGTDTLRNAWAGGLDSPQFSSIDLNADGQEDLFIFDRRIRRVLTYLNVAAGGGRQWQYAPDYEALFPVGIHNFALLRDYDCDGRPDLFTSGTSEVDIQVFRNVAGPGGRPSFQLVTALLSALVGANQVNINTGVNLPAITDVNGDGRLDILLYDWDNNKYVTYYRNTSTSACGGLQFALASASWGNIQSCLGSCGSYSFSPTTLCRPGGVQHTFGSNILALDLDADGDKDLVIGRDYCSELVAMVNQGNSQQESMSATSLNSSFPTGTTPARVPNFPAGYHLDVNFDGRLDLLVAPSVFDNLDTLDTRQSVWFYENAGTGAATNFQFRQQDFLQRDMIEASSLAAPAFLDVDGDGLKDMLVAGTRRDAPGNFFVASVAHYRNTGTATRAVYQLVTTDYLNLSSKKFGRLQPVIVDLNRDGALDLACIGYYATGRSSFLGFYLNQAAAGQAPSFTTSTMRTINNVPNGEFDTATFFDVDNDGNVDLLYGTNSIRTDLPGQSLRYYRNNGSSSLENAFVVANADYGQIRSANNTRPVNLCPLVADFDSDGTPDLLVTDASGTVRLFSNLRAQSSVFLDCTNLFYNNALGSYENALLGVRDQNHFTLAANDVDGDGGLELFIGMESGGVLAAAPRNRVLSTRNAAQNLPLSLYPNPATSTTTVEAPQPVQLTLLDLTGRTMRKGTILARRHEVDLRGLAAGLYLVRCETTDGRLGMQRLVVK